MGKLDRSMFSEEQWKLIQEAELERESMDFPRKQSAFAKSKFSRVPGDFYPTIDERCTKAVIETFDFEFMHDHCFVDPCAPQGSGIIDTLKKFGYSNSACYGEVFDDLDYHNDIIITNPPYKRGLIGPIMRELIRKVNDRGAIALYVLLRTGFDHGRAYADIFDHPFYAGQLKLRFRPWWSEDHSVAPLHNFSWHVWADNWERPNVWYWPKGRKGDK